MVYNTIVVSFPGYSKSHLVRTPRPYHHQALCGILPPWGGWSAIEPVKTICRDCEKLSQGWKGVSNSGTGPSALRIQPRHPTKNINRRPPKPKYSPCWFSRKTIWILRLLQGGPMDTNQLVAAARADKHSVKESCYTLVNSGWIKVAKPSGRGAHAIPAIYEALPRKIRWKPHRSISRMKLHTYARAPFGPKSQSTSHCSTGQD
jgi:hypothetical protein